MAFDPYREWLGISSPRPHAFALLGVSHRETDSAVIRRAADERLNQLRSVRPGEQIERWQKLMEEVEAARDLLLDPAKRQAYLQKLKAKADSAKAKGSASGSTDSPSSDSDDAAPLSAPTAPAPAKTPVAAAPTTAQSSPSTAPSTQASPSQLNKLESNNDAFDPMAPLAPAPVATFQPQPVASFGSSNDPSAPLTQAESSSSAANPATVSLGVPVLGQSSPGGVGAKHRDFLRKRRIKRLVVGATLFLILAITAGVGFAYRQPLLAKLGLDAATTNPESESTTGPTPSDPNPSDSPNTESTNTSDPSDSQSGEGAGGTNGNGPPTDNSSTNLDSTESSETGDSTDPLDPDAGDNDPDQTESEGEDPSMDDESMDDESMDDETMDDAEEEEPRELTRSEAYAVSQGAAQVLVALRAGDLETVEARLSYLRLMTEGSEEAEWVEHLAVVVQTNAEFWETVANCVAQLESAEDLEVTPDLVVKVVEASKERLVYRVTGTREERAPRDLPPGLARFIVEHIQPDNPNNGRLIGAMYAAESANDGSLRDKAESAWRESETAEVDVEPLLSWLNDDFDGLATRFPPAEAPADDEIATAREQLETDYADLLDGSKTPAARIELGEQLFTEATTMDTTADGFVRFALACELVAGSGQSTLLEPKIEVWKSWFKIDEFKVLADLLTRCAKISAEPEECKNTVAMAMQAAQQAAGRGRKEEALALMDAAMDAAQKSRDAQLRTDTLMQTRTLRQRLNQSE